jgi:hypothetical protein
MRLFQKPEDPERVQNATIAKALDTSPESAHLKDNKDRRDLSDPGTMRVTSATTVEITATSPENVTRSPDKEKTEAKTRRNATTAKRSVTSQETVPKEVTERKTSNVISVMKTDISQEIAKVI